MSSIKPNNNPPFSLPLPKQVNNKKADNNPPFSLPLPKQENNKKTDNNLPFSLPLPKQENNKKTDNNLPFSLPLPKQENNKKTDNNPPFSLPLPKQDNNKKTDNNPPFLFPPPKQESKSKTNSNTLNTSQPLQAESNSITNNADTSLSSPSQNQENKQTLSKNLNDQSLVHKTLNINPSVLISTNKISNKIPESSKFLFFFTGGSKEMLLDGIKVELDMEMAPIQCRDYLLQQLSGILDITGKQLIVYLSCGLPFIGGTLGDLYLNKEMKVKKVIYGVFTRLVSDKVLKSSFLELCNASDNDHKIILSPLCDSSKRGLSDMSCLLGYLNHDGIKSDILLNSLASVTHFPPLITSMKRIIDKEQVVGRDVITVCSTLFTYFRAYLPETCPDDRVFEYSLRLCNLITHINDIPKSLPIQTIDICNGSEKVQFLVSLKQGPRVYLWQGDSNKSINWIRFNVQGEEAIENSYKVFASFTPISPLSMRCISSGATIVKGKDHEYLFMNQNQSKERDHQNNVDIIDPFCGYVESFDVEEFAKFQGIMKDDETINLIDPDNVQQITMVDLDESGSMLADIEGYKINEKNPNQVNRMTIAFQYLSIFANRTYNYRIPSIQGLVSFNQKPTIRCPLSPLVPDFEDKGFNIIVDPRARTKLWDSLIFCCDEIIKYRKDKNGNEKFKNAKSRILVISDGEDKHSKATVEEVVIKMIQNNIIVDSIIINTYQKEVEQLKILCAVCHATGGISYKIEEDKPTKEETLKVDYIPNGVKKGLGFFEKTALLNINERKLFSSRLIPGNSDSSPIKLKRKTNLITNEFMKEASKYAEFDTDAPNVDTSDFDKEDRFATPRHVCTVNCNTQFDSSRLRRILRELHHAIQTNSTDSARYDPDMKIYTVKSNFDKWVVFLKGMEGTPYENKWWQLLVTFPKIYPVLPPIFRFITIPYHINVSVDGRICLNSIEKGYMPSKNVVEMIQEIKELFCYRCEETFVQLDIYHKYKVKPDEYMRLAKESADKNARDSIEDYIPNQKNIYDSVPVNSDIQFDDYIPPHMRSQISGKAITEKNKYFASSGVFYDIDEFKQLITSNKNPVCIITGKQLTERPEDFTEIVPDSV